MNEQVVTLKASTTATLTLRSDVEKNRISQPSALDCIFI